MNIALTKQSIKNQDARRIHNAREAQDDSTFTGSIPLEWVTTFKQLQEFAKQAQEGPALQLMAIIANMHKEHTNPFVPPSAPLRSVRTVNRDDILRVAKWNGKYVTNYQELDLIEQTDAAPLLMIIGKEKYIATDIMACLKGEIKVVQPFGKLPLKGQ